MEVWKSQKDSDYPINFQKVTSECATRAVINGNLMESGRTDLVKCSFQSDASKAWNRTPSDIKNCDSIWAAKKAIKKFVKLLPI